MAAVCSSRKSRKSEHVHKGNPKPSKKSTQSGLRVHGYDGQLPALPREPTITLEHALKEIFLFFPELVSSLSCFTSAKSKQVFDKRNNLDPNAVFCLAWEATRSTSDLRELFREQVLDKHTMY